MAKVKPIHGIEDNGDQLPLSTVEDHYTKRLKRRYYYMEWSIYLTSTRQTHSWLDAGQSKSSHELGSLRSRS